MDSASQNATQSASQSASQQTMRAYTRQVIPMWEELQRTGRYYVREEYVREKNDTIADYYLELYRWATAASKRHGAQVPEGLTLPIWLSLTEAQRLRPSADTVSLTLDIPRESMCIIDYNKWGYRVNDWYVPLDSADEDRHNAALKQRGIVNEAQLIMGEQGNFYPDIKRKIIASWDRVFEPNEDMNQNVGICWEIVPEWIVEAVVGNGEQ
ncbi:MAG: DUF3841 domain-containing protein [Atopobiaceae bacterium]|jgi:hypothetical protein